MPEEEEEELEDVPRRWPPWKYWTEEEWCEYADLMEDR